MIDNKSILVSGGTGSFGNTILKKLLSDYQPKGIVIFSRDEKKQLDMRNRYKDPRINFLHVQQTNEKQTNNRAKENT